MGASVILIVTITTIVIGGSFQFGYQTGVVNEPEEVITKFISNASERRGLGYSNSTVDSVFRLMVAAFPAGGLIGGCVAGRLADGLGRRLAMIVMMVPSLVASLLMIMSRITYSFEMLIIGRFLIGIACGTFTALSPMYLSEIAPLHLRGALGTMNQMIIVLAILLSQVLGLSMILGTGYLWPLLVGLTIIPSVFALVVFPFCPESPRFLMLSKNDESAARDALHRLRGSVEVESEIAEMRRELEAMGSVESMSILKVFKVAHLRKALIIGIVMQLSQQLSGINAVINYSTIIFKQTANLSLREANFLTIGIGAFNVVVTALSVFLMDRAGRKTLHLLGLSLMTIWTLILTVALNLRHQFPEQSRANMGMVYLGVVAVFLYVGAFALGPGAIPWFIVAELCTQASRGAVMTVAVAVNWICQIVIAEAYPYMQDALKDYSFLPFLILLVLFTLYTYWQVPETKGKTPEEMETLFKNQSNVLTEYQSLNDDDDENDEILS